ncbi:transposase IS66, partial [mine drainage metagenome]
KLLREIEELRGENLTLRKEIERLRPALEKSREKNARLTDKAEGLNEKLEGLRNSLSVLGTDAKTAAAVGVPSSRVFFRQPPPPPGERRPTGGQPGHPGTTRPRPIPNAPPRVLSLANCPDCATRLGAPCDSSSHPLTDLPEGSLEIYDVTVNRYKCSGCGRRVHAPVPEGYRGEFGPRLKTFVATLRAQGMSVEKIAELLMTVYRLEVSVASLLAMEEGWRNRWTGPTWNCEKR